MIYAVLMVTALFLYGSYLRASARWDLLDEMTKAGYKAAPMPGMDEAIELAHALGIDNPERYLLRFKAGQFLVLITLLSPIILAVVATIDILIREMV